jgi:polyferredoxin
MCTDTNNVQVLTEDQEVYRDSLSTIDGEGKRIWLYPKRPSGHFYKARTLVSFAFLALFLLLPFIKVGGEPLLLFNVLERKFILFGLLFTPQDFHLFGLAMLTFIVFIILFTVVYGRLFCGWICPQTVFMEMFFRKIEYWIEGDSNEQRKLDKAPWTKEKIRKKALKHTVFFAIAVVVSNYFLAYIIGMDQVIGIIRAPISQNIGGFGAMLLFSGVFYGVFARMREQVCTTICPYGRLQGVLLVRDSIVVTYDHVRGEPRGKLKKTKVADRVPGAKNDPVLSIQEAIRTPMAEKSACGDHDDGKGACKNCDDCAAKKRLDKHVSALSLITPELVAARRQGDCIDCGLCVSVCPTGIDIRNGTQLECINCSACMDACDGVMDKIGKPRGLVRYDSATGVESGRRHLFTTRVYAYTGVLVALLALDAFLLVRRGAMESIILRSPGQLYQQVDSAHISNLYSYVLINKSNKDLPVQIVSATAGSSLRLVGQMVPFIPKGGRLEGAFFVEMPLANLKGRKTPIHINIISEGKTLDKVSTNFMGPNK